MKPAVRIAHVTSTFPPYRGGTGNVCYHNARELAARGFDVHVFTAFTGQAAQDELCESITIHRLPPLFRFGNAPLLPQLFSSLRGFDIIHLHYPFFGGELAAFSAWAGHTPLVITYHQDVLLKGRMAAVEKGLRFTTGRMTLRSAQRVLFTSLDYGAASYTRPLLTGREAQIDELPNGVDTTCFTPGQPPEELRARLGIAPSDRVALLVAGLDRAHYFKGVEVFLRALAELPATCKGVIVGDGDLRPQYTSTANTLGLGERVCFAGRVPDQDLPDYYRMASVTVLPSVTMGEAFGLVLVESLACATPVIASRLPGVRTVVRDGVDGCLTEPGDAHDLADKMAHLLNQPELCAEMGRRGRARVEEKYAWPKIADRLVEIYTQVLLERNR